VNNEGLGNVAFEGCVLSVLSDMRFELPPGNRNGITLHYPLTLASHAPGDGG
jgi:hypothetical protein